MLLHHASRSLLLFHLFHCTERDLYSSYIAHNASTNEPKMIERRDLLRFTDEATSKAFVFKQWKCRHDCFIDGNQRRYCIHAKSEHEKPELKPFRISKPLKNPGLDSQDWSADSKPQLRGTESFLRSAAQVPRINQDERSISTCSIKITYLLTSNEQLDFFVLRFCKVSSSVENWVPYILRKLLYIYNVGKFTA